MVPTLVENSNFLCIKNHLNVYLHSFSPQLLKCGTVSALVIDARNVEELRKG